MELPRRKTKRLQDFDYSSNGAYFVTICTKNKAKSLSEIVGRGLAPAEIRLTEAGRIAEKQLLALKNTYAHITVPQYVIMPNHIHAIIVFEEAAGASPRPTLMDVVCRVKSLTVREYGQKLWQDSFYDHVIRTEQDYQDIWAYIDGNPGKWLEDQYYTL